MTRSQLRVLQSFPHKIGAGRICDIAWHQAEGVAAAGARLTVFPGAVARALPPGVEVQPTLARGRFRIPYRALGLKRALALHDRIVARRLEKLSREIDVVHTWPLGATETIRTARRLGITTVLERPNAHTRYAYASVLAESQRIGVELPPGSEHAFDAEVLRREEVEYELADALLCPSEFTRRSFLDEGFDPDKLVRHTYGYDESVFYPGRTAALRNDEGLTVVFVGMAAVRKGLHLALEAWLRSPASATGRFLIAGDFLPAYRRYLESSLAHPSVVVLGQRGDVADLMRASDVMILPSLEEGFGLVCVEALACGAVPLVSRACTEICEHGVNALVHDIGDVDTLCEQLTLLNEDRPLLARLQRKAVEAAPAHTWMRAGEVLVGAYEEAIRHSGRTERRQSRARSAS